MCQTAVQDHELDSDPTRGIKIAGRQASYTGVGSAPGIR